MVYLKITDRYDRTVDIKLFFFFFFFFWGGGVEALCPSQQFFSHVGTESPLPGYYQYLLEGKCILLKEIQHGHPSEDRTPDLSLRSPTLYH